MANLSISAASVATASININLVSGRLGETIAKGDIVYKNNDTGLWMLLDATILGVKELGMCVSGGVLNDVGTIQRDGYVTINAVATAATQYYVSATPGKLCPRGDLTTGDYITPFAIATQTTTLAIHAYHSGIPA